jgi:hypothetical protein
MRKQLLIAGIFAAFFVNSLSAQDFLSVGRIMKHIEVLAHDSLMGRATGSIYEAKAARYIANEFQKAGLKPMGSNGAWLQEFDFQVSSHGVKGRNGKANNVIGYLDNGAKYTVVIGGHYDHLGTGEDGNSLDGKPEGKIHNGADDNASGIAGVIELAHFYAGNKEKEAFNFLFVCFSGEELGLFGSVYFVEHCPVPVSSLNCMINMDMIGRLSPDKPVLTISGVGTAPEFKPILSGMQSKALELQLDSAGVGPSDHTSFYNKQVPALHFFTGTHLDYHKPSDDVEKINSRGTEVTLNIIASLIAKLPGDRKLEFLKTRNPSMGNTPSFKVTLGIMPSYAGEGEGMKVEAVLDGKPAKKAGIQDGDLILFIGEHRVTEVQSYMKALSKFSKGESTIVKVKRGTETLNLPVTF